MIKVMEIEVNKEALLKGLNYDTTAEQVAEATHLPIEICDLVVSAFHEGEGKYSSKYFDMSHKYENLCKKVCEKLL